MSDRTDDFKSATDRKVRTIIIREMRAAKGAVSVAAHNLGFTEETLRYFFKYYDIHPADYAPDERTKR